MAQATPLQHLDTAAEILEQRHGDGAQAEALRSVRREVDAQIKGMRLITAISQRLLNLPLSEVEQGIEAALAELGQSSQVQRAYIFLLSQDGTCLASAYEWCSPEAEPHDFTGFKGVPVTAFPWSMAQFLVGETVFVLDPGGLPPEAEAERGACEQLSIDSYVNMPLFIQGRLRGWLGFDSVGARRVWSEEEVGLMSLASDVLISAIERMHRDEAAFKERELNQRIISMGTMVAGLSHELNNPLAYISTNLECARFVLDGDKVGPEEHRELSEILTELEEGIERMGKVVGHLRDFARGDSPQIVPVKVEAVLEATFKMAALKLRHRVHLHSDCSPDLQVMGSVTRLSQVILNLLLNAASAMPEGRASGNEIAVKVRGKADNKVLIEVSDNGVGIEAQHVSRIFDPFYTTRPVGEGMGLGLSICFNIVTAFGGQLEVQSQPGEGTTFSITLLAPEGDEVVVSQDAGRRRLLLIDDEPLVHKSLKRGLRDFDISSALNGREALAMLAKSRYDVILCDVMMPEITGLDVVRRLEETDPEALGKLIFITGGVFDPAVADALEALPNTCVAKPYTLGELRAAIAALGAGRAL